MNVYYFSSHPPDPKMLRDLGGSIKAHFRGTISNVHARNDQISFTETLHIGGQEIKTCHTIQANSIVVIEAPPILQKSWLDAGVSTLLTPQMHQQASGAWHQVVFQYQGLQQIHKIEVVSSQWAGGDRQDKQPPSQETPILPDATLAKQQQDPALFGRID